MDIKKWLEKYSTDYYREMYGNQILGNAESREKSMRFLRSYSLSAEDYNNECLPVMQKVFAYTPADIFDIGTMSPYQLFRSGFCLSLSISSPVFDEGTWFLTQKIGKAFGEKYCYVVEEEGCEEDTSIALKLRIPLSINWDALADGGLVSAILLNMPHNNYYVFGDSGKWGKWCDYENPWIDYEIMGTEWKTPEIEDYKKVTDNIAEYINTSGIRLPKSLEMFK